MHLLHRLAETAIQQLAHGPPLACLGYRDDLTEEQIRESEPEKDGASRRLFQRIGENRVG